MICDHFFEEIFAEIKAGALDAIKSFLHDFELRQE